MGRDRTSGVIFDRAPGPHHRQRLAVDLLWTDPVERRHIPQLLHHPAEERVRIIDVFDDPSFVDQMVLDTIQDDRRFGDLGQAVKTNDVPVRSAVVWIIPE